MTEVRTASIEQLEAGVYVAVGMDEVVGFVPIGIEVGTDGQSSVCHLVLQLTSVAIGGGPTCGRAGGGGG